MKNIMMNCFAAIAIALALLAGSAQAWVGPIVSGGGGGGAVDSVAGKTGTVTLNKTDVGLPNVDNTSDANKPVSTAQQTALNGKVPATRTLTINGTTLDLSADRSFTVAGGSAITVQDEGSALTSALTTLNFVGAGVSCTGSAPVVCTITGSAVGDAAADGTTKGQATYSAADFNAAAGVISIDYTNGQAATSGAKGFLTATDWTAFNNKQAAISFGTGVQTALGVTPGSAGSFVVNGGVGAFSTLNTTGLNTMPGAVVTAANAMGALAIDVTKTLNTKTISADSTFTFSATATTDATFTLIVTNSDTNPHVLTFPSFYSMGRNATVTTAVVPASGKFGCTWRYDGSVYQGFCSDGGLNNFIATANPAVTDDASKGYAIGSFWYNASANTLYIAEGVSAGAANWTLVTGAGGSMTWPAAAGIAVYAGSSAWGTSLTAPSGAIVGSTDTQTLTNKRLTKRIGTEASSAASAINSDSYDQWNITALAAADTIGAPSGTPTDGQQLVIRIKDNGTARALTWNAAFRASSDLTLPTTTTLGKTLYVGFVWNAADSKWDLLAKLDNF